MCLPFGYQHLANSYDIKRKFHIRYKVIYYYYNVKYIITLVFGKLRDFMDLTLQCLLEGGGDNCSFCVF